MSPQKGVLLVVLLLLVIFAVVLALGWNGSETGDSTERPDWFNALSGALPGSQPVKAASLSAPCFNGAFFTVRPGPPCPVTVAPASDSVRLLKLQLVAGNKVRVRLEGENGGLNIPVKIAKPKVPDLQVLKEGASLSLACELPPPGPNAPCLLSLRP